MKSTMQVRAGWTLTTAIILLTFSTVGCTQENSDQSVLDQITNDAVLHANGDSRWRLGDSTDFQWDEVLIIPPYASQSGVEMVKTFDLREGVSSRMEQRDAATLLVFGFRGKQQRAVLIPIELANFTELKAQVLDREKAVFRVRRRGLLTNGTPNWEVSRA